MKANIKNNKPEKKKDKFSFYCFLLLVCLIFSIITIPGKTKAAQLNFYSENEKLFLGQSFKLTLFINTEEEEINAIEGQIIFPSNLLNLREIYYGDSVINLWIEKPKAEEKCDEICAIKFSGIIPGGYNGVNKILSAIFETKRSGKSSVLLKDIKVLLNDGEGKSTNVKLNNFNLNIQNAPKEIETENGAIIKDSIPPENFTPEILKDPNIFENNYFIVFETQDKISGINYYEIQENKKNKIIEKKWERAESPYLLKDQKLRSYIHIKAVDKMGNERIVTVAPKYPLKWYELPIFWIIIIIITFILYLLRKIIKSKFKIQISK